MFGIRIIFGLFGVGKGLTNTIIARNEMCDKLAYESALAEIQELETTKQRTFTYPPQEHIVFSNYKIKFADIQMSAYDFDPAEFMLPTDELDFSIFPPYASFHVEEGYSGIFSAYDWQKFPAKALEAYSQVRHPRYIFTIDLPLIEGLNSRLRSYAFEYLCPLEIQHEYNCFNYLTKTTSCCAVFHSYNKALEFEKTKNHDLIDERREYTFTGNIYDCYDSHNKKEGFFAVGKSKDFVYKEINK